MKFKLNTYSKTVSLSLVDDLFEDEFVSDALNLVSELGFSGEGPLDRQEEEEPVVDDVDGEEAGSTEGTGGTGEGGVGDDDDVTGETGENLGDDDGETGSQEGGSAS